MAGPAVASSASRALTPQGQERKQALLDHAAALFADRGYAETRVIDIVKAAGVAKGLFYWYFENKEAVFVELAENLRFRLRVEQASAIQDDARPLVRIRQGVEASVRFMGEHRRLYSLFDVETLDPDIAARLRVGADVHTADTARHIRAAIAAGDVRDEDPDALAHAVVGTVALFTHLHRTGALTLELDEVAAFAGRWVVRALAADEGTAAEAESAFTRSAR